MIVTTLESILRTTLGRMASDTGRPFQPLHFDWYFNVFWVWYWYYLGFVYSKDTWIDWISRVLSTSVDTLDLVCEITDTCISLPVLGGMTYLDIGATIDIVDVLSLATGNNYCMDTDYGATDEDGDGCSDYTTNPSWCGGYDDDDFTSETMCCACQGGRTILGGGAWYDYLASITNIIRWFLKLAVGDTNHS